MATSDQSGIKSEVEAMLRDCVWSMSVLVRCSAYFRSRRRALCGAVRIFYVEKHTHHEADENKPDNDGKVTEHC
jgi:hypothetical protein